MTIGGNSLRRFLLRTQTGSPMSTESLLESLRATRWGTLLTSDQLARVAAESAESHAATGSYVCRKGEAVDSWLGILDGLVKMMTSTSGGRTSTFTGIPAGGWFGEGSLLKTEPRRYDVVALR